MQQLRNGLAPRNFGFWKRNSMHLKWHWTNPGGIMRIPHKWCRQANQHGAMPNYRHISGNPNHSQQYDWIRKSQIKMYFSSTFFLQNAKLCHIQLSEFPLKYKLPRCFLHFSPLEKEREDAWSGYKSFCWKRASQVPRPTWEIHSCQSGNLTR